MCKHIILDEVNIDNNCLQLNHIKIDLEWHFYDDNDIEMLFADLVEVPEVVFDYFKMSYENWTEESNVYFKDVCETYKKGIIK